MLRRTSIVTIGTLAVFAARFAHAQTPATAPRELTLAVGLAHSQRVDEVISPLIYDGSGGDALLRYRRPILGADVATLFRGGWRNLSTDATANTRELSMDGELRFDIMQKGLAEHSIFRPVFGLGTQLSSTVTDHHYSSAIGGDKAFVYGMAAVGPVARWDATLQGGRIGVQLGAPLTGVVVHPYSAIRAGRPLFEPHAFTPATLRSPDVAVSYAAAARGGFSWFSEYRANATRYDSVLPVRGFAQTLYVGLIRRAANR